MSEYNPKDIEKKWQDIWATEGTYTTKENGDNFYILDMFPYPSGAALHVGHPKGYIATDIYSRMMRMKGKNVLHPMGWDAFGLPAEQFAIKNKLHPKVAVDQNVARFKEQLQSIGFDYDWSREINTTDSEYYKWTQWAFIQMHKAGLTYQSHEPINWCPECKTGLANEDLEDGKCERCGSVVEKKPLRQWGIKITKYADRLLEDMVMLDKWPESTKASQRNWIGKKEGSNIPFNIKVGDRETNINVFTTRADTLFGVSYLVLAPEHGFIHEFENEIQNLDEVKAYIEEVSNKSDLDRQQTKEKTGVELKGVTATNPANGEEVPVWVADYVLASFGTGAVMAVPAHDERDFEFAKKFGLEVKQVVEPLAVTVRGDSAVVPGEPFIKRDNVAVVLKNPINGKYLCTNWKEHHMHGVVTGGIDEGEDIIECAIREIKEETGYKNVKFSHDPKFAVQTKFFHRMKKLNRWARFQIICLELENEECEEIEEHEDVHELVWMDAKEMESYATVAEAIYCAKIASNKDYIFTEQGVLSNSGEFNGLTSEEARVKITEKVGGEIVTNYRLQDWTFSRQRYWGEPIPMVFDTKGDTYPLAESELPLKLPEVDSYEPTGTGESPLAGITDWVQVKGKIVDGSFVTDENGEEFRRETNTMPQWAGSSWYYLRYMDPANDSALVDGEIEKNFMPVDVYVGGVEHATRHLIYARFWHKFLFDIGVVSTKEPFMQLHSPGVILAEDGRKMSKRWGNTINPDEMVNRFGADAFRTYEMFMGPFENTVAWNTDGVVGTRRFIEKVWRIKDKLGADNPELDPVLHETIQKVSRDIPLFKFNTCISSMMICTSAFDSADTVGKSQYKLLLQILAPFAPHMTEELWRDVLGEKESIHLAEWPTFDPEKIKTDTVEMVFQINGKVRAKLDVVTGLSEDEVVALAKENKQVQKWITGEPKKVIYVKDKLLNIVI